MFIDEYYAAESNRFLILTQLFFVNKCRGLVTYLFYLIVRSFQLYV